jgi:hypothetical protein
MNSKLLAQFKIPGQGGSEEVVTPKGIPSGGLDDVGGGLLTVGYEYLFYLAIFLAIIFLLFSGIQMITSGGDAIKLAAARRRLIYAIVGLVIVLLAFWIVSIVFQVVGVDTKLFSF